MSQERLLSLSIAEMIIVPRETEPVVVSTVLGSCVSVALFCTCKDAGGIIHFALPSQEQVHGSLNERTKELGDLHFGATAIPILVHELCMQAEVPQSHLRAKIIGGAAVTERNKNSPEIGRLNIEIAEKVLSALGIPIVAREVGGTKGRKLRFYPQSGRLLVATLGEEPAKPTKNSGGVRIVAPDVNHREVTQKKKKRVLIIDDSKTIRNLLTKILSEDPQLEVVGGAADPIEAEPMIKSLRPDVLTLDIHMPRMDGVTFLQKLLPKTPIPVVMITAITMAESNDVFRALELGAVDYIQKPSHGELPVLAPFIRERVLCAAMSGKIRIRQKQKQLAPKKSTLRSPINQSTIIAIGASTGGTEALKDVLLRLPAEIPPIVIVQHIPAVFSKAFADRLNELCSFAVKEAEDGDVVQRGRVLIAPGGHQMAVEMISGTLKVKINDDAPVNRHKPSVDYLFDSVAKVVGKKAVGVILTGMGNDGAQGLLKMKRAGARTIGQDEASCVVYGMPKVAFDVGAVDEVHSLDDIPEVLLKWLSEKKMAS